MNIDAHSTGSDQGVRDILHVLEGQLQRLDAIGAAIAAAHLDAAIQQLRTDLAVESLTPGQKPARTL